MNASDFTKLLAPLGLALLAPALVTSTGCKKDEPPPPLPSAAPEPATTAPPLELVPEDAGPEDAGTDAGKKVGGRPGPSLKACCVALEQNAHSAPEPNAGYMRQAAATCHAMVKGGAAAGPVLGAVRGMLQGAGMPAACR